ncbi:PAS domain S-box protein [Aquibacillus halophilus]|uniref:histidine kinase n=2 Tax=Aquibacillus halophilus TaxID=930132 RepID=A0A6A8DBD5_9BACI|nr:PAS domain S-box protein [Aquibacillus halophilus]
MLKWIEDNSFDIIVLSDLKGKILYISSSVDKILGYYPDEIVGKLASDYISPHDKKLLSTRFQKHLNNTQKFNISIRNKDGRYIWVESILSIINDKHGNRQIIAIAKDITDKKEAEEMMIRSEKMSVAGQLAAGVAHEIRNPLTSLKGFVQLLQAGIEKKDEYYKIMIDEIEKINSITSELLFISKPMTDNRNFERLSEMLSDVVTLLSSQAKLFDVKIILELEEDVSIFCDKTQIKQVLINLIKNAVEEMTEGGEIHIVVESNKHQCAISIIDEGPGIPQHILHKLKEPFFTTKKDGTGLGLMISEKIIENHNGTIDIFQNIEKGSTFQITLPLHQNSI